MLTYLRKVKKSFCCEGGFEYLHDFGTGYQNLVFATHAEAVRFAGAEGLEYRGAKK